MRKICIVLGTHWSALMGGAQFQCKCITEALITDPDIDVWVLARYIDPAYSPQGYKLEKIPSDTTLLKRPPLFFDYHGLTKLLDKIKPDIIYQRGRNGYTGIVAYYSKKHTTPFFYHIASDKDVYKKGWAGPDRKSPLKIIDNKIGGYGLRNATHIIAQTETQSQLLNTHYEKKAAAVIYNFHPFPQDLPIKRKDYKQVLWIANYKPVKRPELFVRLAKDLEHCHNTRFIMVGKSNKKYINLNDEIKESGNIDQLGELPVEKVNQLLSESHILVNTSEAEGFSNTFIQAWMREVPVISIKVDPDDMIKKYNLGFSDGTYDGAVKYLEELLKNEEKIASIGTKARKFAYDNFSLRNIDKLVQLFRLESE